mmetsp:Transcript_12029/g.17630  ORF Transcript_12029/g.17630 Transcript_12029/m.17630 type:complete len:91 (-) Transcript_12029:77-349(-)
MKKIEFSFAGSPNPAGSPLFYPPPSNWKPWKAAQAGIGDLPVFSQALGDGRTPFSGPAALIGLDVLAQRRLIFETASNSGRKRSVFVSSS